MRWANSASDSSFHGLNIVGVPSTDTMTGASFVICFRSPLTATKYSWLAAMRIGEGELVVVAQQPDDAPRNAFS
eukprot:2165153-Prymnesium_polylepis.1